MEFNFLTTKDTVALMKSAWVSPPSPGQHARPPLYKYMSLTYIIRSDEVLRVWLDCDKSLTSKNIDETSVNKYSQTMESSTTSECDRFSMYFVGNEVITEALSTNYFEDLLYTTIILVNLFMTKLLWTHGVVGFFNTNWYNSWKTHQFIPRFFVYEPVLWYRKKWTLQC